MLPRAVLIISNPIQIKSNEKEKCFIKKKRNKKKGSVQIKHENL